MKSNRKLFLILIFIVPLTVIFSQCLTVNRSKPDPRGEMFAGSATCAQCHKDIYDDFLHTAHFSTTRLADIHSIGGSFAHGANQFFFNKDMKVVMEKRDSGLFQVAYQNGKEIKAERFDITFGGVKAETYLYWQGNHVYQLPLSWFHTLGWTNSPGYDSTHADFGRMIGRRCFECHASYIKNLPMQVHSLKMDEQFDKTSLVMGIDCERCHGPAANHVNYQLANPDEKKAKYIATYASLSRSMKIDMCAACHSGNKSQILRNMFTFKPGDTLANFKEQVAFQKVDDSSKMDVHGNQTQLLASSKCFINSNMDCATCHNVHKNERQNIAMFSQRCMTCHTGANHNFCKLAPQLGAVIKSNCIDCHMPARSSNVIAIETAGKGRAVPYLVRSHHVAVYADASAKVMANFKKYNKLTSK